MPKSLLALSLLSLFVTVSVSAAPAGQQRTIRFAPGKSTGHYAGRIQGQGFADYLFQAAAGQKLQIQLESQQPGLYFNLLAAQGDTALFNGSLGGAQHSRILPSGGSYVIRVYLMGQIAREQAPVPFVLKLGLSGQPLVPVPAAQDALIPGTAFHAQAEIPCSQNTPALQERCQASVQRWLPPGSATLEVRLPDGQKQQILFVKGRAISSDSPEALQVKHTADNSLISLGTAVFLKLPDTLLWGG